MYQLYLEAGTKIVIKLTKVYSTMQVILQHDLFPGGGGEVILF
jgi:hypothetical protein